MRRGHQARLLGTPLGHPRLTVPGGCDSREAPPGPARTRRTFVDTARPTVGTGPARPLRSARPRPADDQDVVLLMHAAMVPGAREPRHRLPGRQAVGTDLPVSP